MATTALDKAALAIVNASFPDAKVDSSTDAAAVSATLYPQVAYTDADKKEIDQWVNVAPTIEPNSSGLTALNTHLSTRTTILGSKPSLADVAIYAQLAPFVKNWSAEERSGEKGYHHVVRHVDFVQNAALFQLKVNDSDKVEIDPSDVTFVIPPLDAKAEKERKKKEKEAAAAAAKGGSAEAPANAAGEEHKGKKEKLKEKVEHAKDAVVAAIPGVGGDKKKKEKKEKQKKPQPEPAKEKVLSPALIDLRVGHILKAIPHPNADSLYVSTIACGDAPGTDNTSEYEGKVVRTVCSGLNGLIPIEELQGRKIVAVCNLKPVTMRGIKSAAMVLAASPRPKEGEDDHHKGPVELVDPPADAEAGERVFFEGWEGEPEGVLNPKKKVWETIQPGFTTTDSLEVAFDAEAVTQLDKKGIGKLQTKQGICKVQTLMNATVR